MCYFDRNMFFWHVLTQKQVSFTETSLCNRNKSCPQACPLQLKVLQNLFLLFLAQNFCHHLYCHLAFFSEQSERTTFAHLIKASLLWEHFIPCLFPCALLKKIRFHLNTVVYTEHKILASRHMQNFEKTFLIGIHYFKT